MHKMKHLLGNRDATRIFLKNIEGVFCIKMPNIITYSMKEKLILNIQKKDLCNKSSRIIKLILEETIEEFLQQILKQVLKKTIEEFLLPEYQQKCTTDTDIKNDLKKELINYVRNYVRFIPTEVRFIPAKDNPIQYLGYRTNRNPIMIDLIIEERNIYTTQEYLQYSTMECNGKFPKLRLKIYDISFLERIKMYFKELRYKCYGWQEKK